MDIFGDMGFVGGSNSAPNRYQDDQQTINYYVDVSPSQSAKVATALLGAPGLIQLVTAGPTLEPLGSVWPQPSAVTNLPVRGSWVLSGSTQALVVIANTCYLVSIVSQGSSTIPGVLSMTSVGTLTSSVGPVSIRDDGLGGYAVIVDGTPSGGYIYTISSHTFAQITDPGFLGSNLVAFIDGWWIFNQPGTQTFYTNALPYAIIFDASLFANKDSFSDKLMGVIENKEELWLIGEKTTEIWYNAGGQYFAFARLVGTLLQGGCKATYSICRFSAENEDGLIWLGRSERGENVIVRTQGFSAEIVSTPGVSDAIAKYPITSDAIGYSYQEDGHLFYVLTFPTADKTWVFDGSVPIEFAWAQRPSYDPYAQAFHRHRSNCFMNFAGMRVVGDYQNGSLYQMTRAAYTDAGWPILARRRAPYIWSKDNRERVFMASLQIETTPGSGTASGLGANPVANLRIAHNGPDSFGQQWPAPLGAIGNNRNRTMWRRLAFGRNDLVEVEVIAPVNRDIIGATLKAFSP